jgi:hypothetical protein
MEHKRIGLWMGMRSLAAVLLVVAVGTYGCNGDDDGDGDGSTGASAFNFTESNMSTAAGIAIGGLEVLPNFTQVTLEMLGFIFGDFAAQPSAYRPADIIPGLCQSGEADLEYSLVGLTASLTFSDCDLEGDGTLIDGPVSLAFAGIPQGGPPLDVDADVTLNITITDDEGSEVITGSFGLSIDSSDLVDYTAIFTAEGAAEFLKAGQGSQSITFGCFNIILSFSPSPPSDLGSGYFLLSPNAVINAGGKIFSISSGGFSPLDFMPYPVEDASYPDEGGMRFFSFVLGDGCAAAGVPGGVGDSDESNFILTALPGDDDDVTLELRDSEDVVQATVNTTWSALTD